MSSEQPSSQSLMELLPELFGQPQAKNVPEESIEILPKKTDLISDKKRPANMGGSENNSVAQSQKPDEPQEDPNFSFDGYQVVRGEFFSHLNEPSITLCEGKISFNQACLKKAPDTSYVLVLVNPDTKQLAVMPSQEDIKNSFLWKSSSNKPRSVACQIVIGMIVHLMKWKPEYRYKMIGKYIKSNGQPLFLFDLKSAEIYQRQIIDENGRVKVKASRKPTYPEAWKEQFGVSFEEHQKALQISIFDKYVVFNVNGKSKTNEGSVSQ